MKDEEITKSSSFDHRSSSSRTHSKPKLLIDDTSDNGIFETEMSDEEGPGTPYADSKIIRNSMNKSVTAATTTSMELQKKRRQHPRPNKGSESLVTMDAIKRKKRIATQTTHEVQLVPTFLKQPLPVPAAAAVLPVSNNSPAAAAGAAGGKLAMPRGTQPSIPSSKTATTRTSLSDTTVTATSISTPFITTNSYAADDNVTPSTSTLSTVKTREVSSVATSTAMARSPLPPDPATAIANVARGSSIARGTTTTTSSSSTPKLLLEEARNWQQHKKKQRVDEVERESGKQLQVRKLLMDKLDTIMNHVLKDDIMMSKRQQQEQQSRNRIAHKFYNSNAYNLLQIDWSGSFITNEDNRYDFYDSDEGSDTSFIGNIPIFSEDFKEGKQPWPLSWWGIVEPSPDIIRAHFPKGEEEQGSGVVAASATKVSAKEVSVTIPATKQSGQQARSYNTDYHYNPNYYHSRPYDNAMGPPQGRLPPPSYYPPRPPYFHGGGPPPFASSATIGPSSYGRGRPGGGDYGMYYGGGGNCIGPYETSVYPRSYHPSTVSASRPKEGHTGTSTSVSNMPHRSNK